MQLIRATPQVMGCRFDGVYNDKGILRFESQEALLSTASKLNDAIDLFDECDKSDCDSPWYRKFPVLDQFNHAIGMDSMRMRLEAESKNMENLGYLTPENDPVNTHHITDEVFLSLLNNKSRLLVGNNLFDYSNKNYIIENSLNSKTSLTHIIEETTSQNNFFDTAKTVNSGCKLVSFKGKQIVADVQMFNVNQTQPFQREFQTFVTYNSGNVSGLMISVSWQIYDSNNALIHNSTGYAPTASRLLYNFPRQGNYNVCVSIIGEIPDPDLYNQREKYSIITCCRTFNIIDTTPAKCCKSYDRKQDKIDYSSGKRMTADLQAYNAIVYYSIRASTTNYEKKRGKWRKRKADFLNVILQGYFFDFVGCKNPTQFTPRVKARNNDRHVSVRVPAFYKKINSDDPNYAIWSNHRVIDGSAQPADLKFMIPKC
ncbi:hypothetical protein BH09BAC1_BH09BAC1_07410 [soil metagenome]